MSDTRITVNGIEYKSPEEMPPDVRRQYEAAMQMFRAGAGNKVVIHKTITFGNHESRPHESLPLEMERYYRKPSITPSEGRRFVYDLAFWTIVVLALWYWLGRS